MSFFVFQAISNLVELSKKSKHVNILHFLTYFTFFPKILQGPITRWSEIQESFIKPHISYVSIFDGFIRFFFGLGKKVILADNISVIVTSVFYLPATSLSVTAAWLGLLSYTLQIYFDFSGYTDMALGLAQILGIRLPENFNCPYLSTSITEFWNRWHLSLSRWLKDYVYIPLGGNRKGEKRTYFNVLAVFVISGLWHGTGFQYLVWGMYHGLWVVIERLIAKTQLRIPSYILRPFTFVVIMIGWVFFRAPSLTYALHYLLALVSFHRSLTLPYTVKVALDTSKIVVMIAGLFITFVGEPLTLKLPKRLNIAKLVVRGVCAAGVFIYALAVIAASSFTPFLYFQF